MNERYAGEDTAPPKIFYHPDFAAENAVHRRYRNHTGSAERKPPRSQTVLPVRNCTLPRRSFAGIILVQRTAPVKEGTR